GHECESQGRSSPNQTAVLRLARRPVPARTRAMRHIPILTSIAELAATADAWIVDIWGVMHNGERAHAAAVEATRAFRAQGGTVVLLSNAPRPFRNVVPHLDRLGVPADAYDAGITSGDMARDMLQA